MHITFACGAMAFGPETPSRVSLGGSETAALMLAKAVAARGHEVTMFCNLPPEGRPDFFPSGEKHQDGVRYVSLQHYQNVLAVSPTDLLIVVRDPNLIAFAAQAKKKVLWMHDIATTRGMKRILEQMMFTFDEIWTVSEWHKEQVAKVTGYPTSRIVALRNGIVKYDNIIALPKNEKQIVYASRPERGLENLVKPGGVMEYLPDFKLVVAMYEHFPEHMKDFYAYIFQCMKRLPNVEFVGGKPNNELRQIIQESAGYIYPTQFEETSCILARECIEQRTPFVTTMVGALPETLGDCGIFFEDWLRWEKIVEPERGSPGWCKLFAMFFRETMNNKRGLFIMSERMIARDDLYWDGVAAMVEKNSQPQPVSDFSRLYSLIQDGDVIPAIAYFKSIPHKSQLLMEVGRELKLYDFVNGDLGKYYDDFYRAKGETAQSELHFEDNMSGPRHQVIAEQVAKLPPGSTIFEYGCGPGHVIGPIAKMFPQHDFVGFDFSASAVEVINKGAAERGMKNLTASTTLPSGKFDAVICSEVLEHVVEPWKLLAEVEAYVKPDGLIIISVPQGPWEPMSYEESAARWKERFHLWSIDRQMMLEMIGERKEFKTHFVMAKPSEWMRPVGNFIFTWRAEHKPVAAINALEKAQRHWSRETVAACIIAYNNEDTILHMLNSLDRKVQFVQIAMGPSTDNTERSVSEWFNARPWMRFNIIDVPKIEARKFGFDDARNASVDGIECEWILWIDTDEYLSGDFRKYLRPSACDGYLIPQHHFTVEPRGKAPEIDRPARLIRRDRGFKAYGHIHEHFELPEGGPGRCIQLADVDIGHPGYVNEQTRQGRFFRNYPFLEWEHEEGGKRKLHKFLWFRDIIHRMRFVQDPAERVKLAQEGVEWYNSNQQDMATFGPGMFMALHYLAECNTVLNRGVPLKLSVQMEDRHAVLEGRFDSYEQIERVLRQLLTDEFTERTSRYY